MSLGLFPILPRSKKVLIILWEFAFITENDRHVDIIRRYDLVEKGVHSDWLRIEVSRTSDRKQPHLSYHMAS